MTWHVARHKPFDGQAAAERVRAAGYEVHAPRQEVRQPGRDDVLKPVFPGYLFVAFGPGAAWGELLRYPIGLVSLLTDTHGTPLPLPTGFVDDFMESANQFGVFPHWWPNEAPAHPSRSVGREFSIQRGPWAGWIGKCKAANKNKVQLLMTLFGRQTVVEFRLDQVNEVA